MKQAIIGVSLGLLGILAAILFVLIPFALGFAVVILPLWFLWNWLMPSLFGLPALTLLQTLGLYVLFGLLAGILRSGGK